MRFLILKIKGELYWNTRRKFYFINRDEWQEFMHQKVKNGEQSDHNKLFIVDNFYDCNFHLIKNKKISYMTYFDKKRENYLNPKTDHPYFIYFDKTKEKYVNPRLTSASTYV